MDLAYKGGYEGSGGGELDIFQVTNERPYRTPSKGKLDETYEVFGYLGKPKFHVCMHIATQERFLCSIIMEH